MAVEAIGVHDQLYKRLAVERMAEIVAEDCTLQRNDDRG
jgi:hypothetical protein